jgi:uncharacterized protein (DUF2345 family)
VGLHCDHGGIQFKAQHGLVSVQAHEGEEYWTARKRLKMTSGEEDVNFFAQKKITVHSGKTAIVLEGENITFYIPAKLDVKSAAGGFFGPEKRVPELPELPEGELPEGELYLEHLYHDNEPLAGAAYEVTLGDGQVIRGNLDAKGQARIKVPGLSGATVTYGPMPGMFERKDKTPNPDAGEVESRVDGLIDKYLGTVANEGETR